MRLARQTSAEDCRLRCGFDTVRKILLEHEHVDRLQKPLAYWALPTDRRLPIALLGRTLGELLRTPFQELTATPGIGQKNAGRLPCSQERWQSFYRRQNGRTRMA